jgi:hypothetical protein
MRRCKKVTLRDEQRKTNKPRAIIVSIDHLNKNFEVKMIHFQLDFTLTLESENDANVLSIPKGKLGDYIEIGDLIEFKISDQNGCKMINLSCQLLRFSKLKRDLISVLRRLDNDNHTLERCVLLNEKGFVLLSAKNNSDKVCLITESTSK